MLSKESQDPEQSVFSHPIVGGLFTTGIWNYPSHVPNDGNSLDDSISSIDSEDEGCQEQMRIEHQGPNINFDVHNHTFK